MVNALDFFSYNDIIELNRSICQIHSHVKMLSDYECICTYGSSKRTIHLQLIGLEELLAEVEDKLTEEHDSEPYEHDDEKQYDKYAYTDFC